ncbi:MAG: ArsR/SmtB family transcription factor [Burkholderiaceae bacterium]
MKTTPEPRFARIASMIGDPTRARMLAHLLDGTLATAGELARAVDVTPQTASAHLSKLLDAELVSMRAQGRHRYFKLADGDIAHALEALAIVAERDTTVDPGRGKWSMAAYRPLREARSCYGHLAGRLGVHLHDALIERDVLVLDEGRFQLADSGRQWLSKLDFDATGMSSSNSSSSSRGGARGIVYPCVDWSERRDHFAGPLAVGLLDHFIAKRWIARVPDSRALSVRAQGRRALTDLFGRGFELS